MADDQLPDKNGGGAHRTRPPPPLPPTPPPPPRAQRAADGARPGDGDVDGDGRKQKEKAETASEKRTMFSEPSPVLWARQMDPLELGLDQGLDGRYRELEHVTAEKGLVSSVNLQLGSVPPERPPQTVVSTKARDTDLSGAEAPQRQMHTVATSELGWADLLQQVDSPERPPKPAASSELEHGDYQMQTTSKCPKNLVATSEPENADWLAQTDPERPPKPAAAFDPGQTGFSEKTIQECLRATYLSGDAVPERPPRPAVTSEREHANLSGEAIPERPPRSAALPESGRVDRQEQTIPERPLKPATALEPENAIASEQPTPERPPKKTAALKTGQAGPPRLQDTVPPPAFLRSPAALPNEHDASVLPPRTENRKTDPDNIPPPLEEKNINCNTEIPALPPKPLIESKPRQSESSTEHQTVLSWMISNAKPKAGSLMDSILGSMSFWSEPEAHLRDSDGSSDPPAVPPRPTADSKPESKSAQSETGHTDLDSVSPAKNLPPRPSAVTKPEIKEEQTDTSSKPLALPPRPPPVDKVRDSGSRMGVPFQRPALASAEPKTELASASTGPSLGQVLPPRPEKAARSQTSELLTQVQTAGPGGSYIRVLQDDRDQRHNSSPGTSRAALNQAMTSHRSQASADFHVERRDAFLHPRMFSGIRNSRSHSIPSEMSQFDEVSVRSLSPFARFYARQHVDVDPGDLISSNLSHHLTPLARPSHLRPQLLRMASSDEHLSLRSGHLDLSTANTSFFLTNESRPYATPQSVTAALMTRGNAYTPFGLHNCLTRLKTLQHSSSSPQFGAAPTHPSLTPPSRAASSGPRPQQTAGPKEDLQKLARDSLVMRLVFWLLVFLCLVVAMVYVGGVVRLFYTLPNEKTCVGRKQMEEAVSVWGTRSTKKFVYDFLPDEFESTADQFCFQTLHWVPKTMSKIYEEVHKDVQSIGVEQKGIKDKLDILPTRKDNHNERLVSPTPTTNHDQDDVIFAHVTLDVASTHGIGVVKFKSKTENDAPSLLGFKMTEGEITLQRAGFYFLYSRITFRNNGRKFSHRVMLKPTNQSVIDVKLLESGTSPVSAAQGTFKMKVGDTVYVTTTGGSLDTSDHAASYLGLYRVRTPP